MDFVTLERKVRRLFGDENNIVIERQDIIDWTNAAQVDIARTTQCLPKDVTQAANTFPVTLPDMISMYRVVYGSPQTPKTFTTLEQIDAETLSYGAQPVGVPNQYYLRANKVYLYPFPATNDTTSVVITYNRMPMELTVANTDPLDVPVANHEDIVRFVLAKAYEKNENYEAVSMSIEAYQAGLSQRLWEKNQSDESFPFVRPDMADWQ